MSSSGNNRFTDAKRARFVALRQAGYTTEAACAATPVSRPTIRAWLARGRGPNARPEEREFAETIDQLAGPGPAPENDDQEPPTDDELVQVLVQASRRGNASAAATLLRRRSRPPEPEAVDDAWPLPTAPDSPFTALDAEDMSLLSREQQAIARAVHDEPDDPVLDGVAAEAEVLKRIRNGEVSPLDLDDLDPGDNTPAARRVRQARWAAYGGAEAPDERRDGGH